MAVASPPDAPLPAGFAAALDRAVPGRWTSGRMERLVYGRDLWPRMHLLRQLGDAAPAPPRAVLWPERIEEVAAVLAAAEEHRVAVVPYGGGAGVCGGALAENGAVTLDLKRMARVVETDAAAGTARVEAGVIGQLLEDELGRRGLTLGHFPSSIMCSTLGGFLAARSAGQLSSRYGKIEDMVVSLRAALPGGRVIDTARGAGAAGGIDWNELLVGAEGTLGVICEATLRVHRAPAARVGRGIEVEGVSHGIEVMRDLMQAGYRPAVLRLYDELDTLMALGPGGGGAAETRPDEDAEGLLGKLRRAGLVPGGEERAPAAEPGRRPARASGARRALARVGRRLLQEALYRPGLLSRAIDVAPRLLPAPSLLVVLFEGQNEAEVRAEADAAFTRVAARGGRDLGPGPADRWLARRYAVSFRQSKIYAAGAFADTMEIATTWDRLEALYRAVRAALGRRAIVMAHLSHAYHEGCSIYFTFAAAAPTPAAALARYDEIWDDALRATTDAGGTISHHHGVGRSKRAYMVREHGAALGILRALSAALDPHELMNPGALGIAPRGPAGAGGGAGAAEEPEPDPDAAIAVDPIGGTVRAPARATIAEIERAARAAGRTVRPWEGAFGPGGTIGDALVRGLAWRLPSPDGPAAARPVALAARLPDGRVFRTTRTPRRAAGPEPAAALLGGAGRGGTLLEVELRAEIPPDAWRELHAELDLAAAVEAARLLARAGLVGRTRWDAGVLKVGLEGPEDVVAARAARALAELGGRASVAPVAAERTLPAGALRLELCAPWAELAATAAAARAAAGRAAAGAEDAAAGGAGAGAEDAAAGGAAAAGGDASAGSFREGVELRLFHFGHEGGRVLVTAPAAAADAVARAIAAAFPAQAGLAALDDALAAALAAEAP